MPATARRHQKADPEIVNPDDPRASLRSLIKGAWHATTGLQKAEDALRRGEDLVVDLQINVRKASVAVDEARETDGRRVAKAIANDNSLGEAEALREAEAKHEEVTEFLRLAEAALPELGREVKRRRLMKDNARNAVCVARNVLLAPLAAEIQQRCKARRLDDLKDIALLTAILSDTGAPEFPHDVDTFFVARDAESARRRPFADVLAGAAPTEFKMIASAETAEDVSMVAAVHAEAMQRLASLLEDADGKLPGEK